MNFTRRSMPRVVIVFAVVLVGCSADGAGSSRAIDATTPAPAMRALPGTAGTSANFDNAAPTTSPAASVGATAAAWTRSNCKGGTYVGKYTCDLDVIGIESSLDGDVSFMLEIDETIVPGKCDSEFCPDLVIAKNSGKLFGIAGDTGWAFEAMLDGGLDCQTGQFRANTTNGVYGIAGSDDPTDPNALTTVVDPPLGDFSGTLSGMRASGPPEAIAGNWDLADAAQFARCTGPFTVELQP